jgi:hypothetical protein
MVTFRINAPAGDFAKLVEELTGRRAFNFTFEYTNSSVTLQTATREKRWNGLDRVVIRGITAGTLYRNAEGKLTARADGEAVQVLLDYGRDYIVFDLTPIGSRTRIDARCHVDGSVRLYFYELLIEIGKDFPEAENEIYAYLRTIFPPTVNTDTEESSESKVYSGGTPTPQLETQQAIHEASQMRAAAIRENRQIPELQAVLDECDHRITVKQFKKHAPELARNWKKKDYRVIVRYNEDTSRWESSEF